MKQEIKNSGNKFIGYQKLTVFQKAHDLSIVVYKITRKFPQEEIFGLTSQMRRCAVSVPANIAEGYGRNGKKDKLQFYYIARGSLNELEYYIDLANELKYYSSEDYKLLTELRYETGNLLHGFIEFTKK
jgi:four helix bundle protein